MQARIVAGVIAVWTFSACSNQDALPFRAMKLTMQTTAQGAADTSVEITSAGRIPTSDPELACTLEPQTSFWSRSIRCSRGDATIATSFDCPITGTKIGALGGTLTIGNTRSHVVHQFSARCEYAQK